MVLYFQMPVSVIPNHRKLFKSMFSLLNDGGILAIQIPQQSKHPVHNIMKSLSKTEKWSEKISVGRKYNNLTENEYYDTLSELTNNFRIWKTAYFYSMPSYESIAQWYKGTGLRPYLEQLSDDDKKLYLEDFMKC